MDRIHVLLIDDQQANLVLYEALFMSFEDVQTHEALSGREAIDLAQQYNFGLILSDVNMPEMDGFETIDRIKQINGYQDISVIFITAQAFDTENILRGYKSGALDYIAKPFDNKILISKIEIHLKLYRQKVQINNQYQELLKNKSIFESITSSIQEAIIITNNLGFIYFWNKSSQVFFGYTENEIQGKSIIELIRSKNIIVILNKLFEGNKGSKVLNIVETLMADKSGFEFPAEFTISKIEDTQSSSGFVFVIREITSKKVQEQHRLKAKELKEANKTMSEFIDNINHELRTPLNQIAGISSMMVKYESEKLNGEQLESIKTIFHESEKLIRIINKILHFRSLSPLSIIIASFKELVDVITGLVTKILAKTGLEYKIDAEGSNADMIPIDLEKYKIVLEELLLNAVKFTTEGEIDVKVYTTDLEFVVDIKDTGIGISEEEIGVIFNEFYQTQSNSDRQYGGLGLGLALANKYVRMMLGRIEVRSVGKGSTFSIRLPKSNGEN